MFLHILILSYKSGWLVGYKMRGQYCLWPVLGDWKVTSQFSWLLLLLPLPLPGLIASVFQLKKNSSSFLQVNVRYIFSGAGPEDAVGVALWAALCLLRLLVNLHTNCPCTQSDSTSAHLTHFAWQFIVQLKSEEWQEWMNCSNIVVTMKSWALFFEAKQNMKEVNAIFPDSNLCNNLSWLL